MGSCGKTCRRACWLNLEAHPAQDESEVNLRICSRDIWFTPFQSICRGRRVACLMRLTQPPLQKKFGGEDRNRTYLDPACAESTTVLKTARATRHPSLSLLRIADCRLQKEKKTSNPPSQRYGVAGAQRSTPNVHRRKKRIEAFDYLIFLIALTIASKSGQSPDSSLEWRSLPLARISKAPPPDGMRVSDLMRSPSSRIWVAKLTAFGV